MNDSLSKNISIIENYIKNNYKNNFREPATRLPYPFVVPGANYTHQLWDWDSWLTGFSLMELDDKDVEIHVKGSVLDFLVNIDNQDRIPILVEDRPNWLFDLNDKYSGNIHKPCLAIQTLQICEHYNDFEWIKDKFDVLKKYLDFYEKNQKHEETGLYFWIDDLGMGFDNDPSAFYKPNKSVGTIFMNTMMYKELLSMSIIAKHLGFSNDEELFFKKSENLKQSILKECFDPVDGFFYSVDLSLKPIDRENWLHSGDFRQYSSLPIRITTWAGMFPLWANIATKEQAEACVKRYLNKEGLFSDNGIRSVAKNEKMYRIVDSGNPSCWIGPIWINANYFTYVGLKNYGYNDLARDIAVKTINLLANDVSKNGDFHEYYNPETGEGVRGLGFQSWNFLVLKMINDLKKEG